MLMTMSEYGSMKTSHELNQIVLEASSPEAVVITCCCTEETTRPTRSIPTLQPARFLISPRPMPRHPKSGRIFRPVLRQKIASVTVCERMPSVAVPAMTAIFSGSHPSMAFCSEPNNHMNRQKPAIETMLFVMGAHA